MPYKNSIPRVPPRSTHRDDTGDFDLEACGTCPAAGSAQRLEKTVDLVFWFLVFRCEWRLLR